MAVVYTIAGRYMNDERLLDLMVSTFGVGNFSVEVFRSFSNARIPGLTVRYSLFRKMRSRLLPLGN